MRIEVNQKEFYKAIKKVKKAISTKTTLPILSGVLLKTINNQLKLVGTDLEIGIECFVNARIIKQGEIVLPGKYLTNIIRELPNKKIILTTEPSNNTAQIKCENSQFNIHGSSTDEFPLLPEIESGTQFKIKQDSLKEIINQVKLAISQDDSKPFLTGGLLLIENGNITLVGTDTYRLAYRNDTIKGNNISSQKVIIPNKTLNELSKLLNNSQKYVEVFITYNQILFKFEGITIVSRLIDGEFPNYKQVIPKKNHTKVTVNKNKLLQATKRASLLAKKDSNIIKINFSQDKLIITSNAPEIGQAYEEVVISLTGQETEIAFNANYLIDCLKVIPNDEVLLELSGSLSPGVIKTKSQKKYIYVIMPVRST